MRVQVLFQEIKTDPNLLEALREAAGKQMTEEEIKAQRENWVRGMMTTGDPRFD